MFNAKQVSYLPDPVCNGEGIVFPVGTTIVSGWICRTCGGTGMIIVKMREGEE